MDTVRHIGAARKRRFTHDATIAAAFERFETSCHEVAHHFDPGEVAPYYSCCGSTRNQQQWPERVSPMANEDLMPAAGSGASPAPRAEIIDPAAKPKLPFGVLALLGAVASMVICYASILSRTVLGIPKLGLNPHLQAALMVGFAVFAVYALWQDRKHHHNNVPAAIGMVAAATLIMTLYIQYSGGIETFAYVLLVIAAFLNQTIFLTVLNRTTRHQAHEIGLLNQRLELKVETQIHEIDHLARLKQFLAPQVADLVVSEGKDKLLDTHRRYIACLFCDIRGFTRLSEDLEPEEVIAILQSYHDGIGRLVAQHAGTIGYRAGDGLMVFFNDPVPCEAPVLDAVRLALDVRICFDNIRAPWSKLGHSIGLGLAIASGYATLGLVGHQGRADYTAIGGVVNVASRLCDRALHGQILLTHRAYLHVESQVQAKSLGLFELSGVKNAIEVYDVLSVRDSVT
jgi:class 3 adenylate cyclase